MGEEEKRPKDGPDQFEDLSNIRGWVAAGGNYGVTATQENDLVIFDIDSDDFQEIVSEILPETFTVQTGSGGFHQYYRCSQFSENQKFSDPKGSIRSNNWYAVGPGSVHPNGSEYETLKDRKITQVDIESLKAVIREVSNREWYDSDDSENPANTAAAPGGVGGGSDAPIPDEYPNREADWSTLRSWLQTNGFLNHLNQTTSTDWSGLEFKLAKCLAEGGFSETSISDALDRLHTNSKWHREGRDYQNLTVQKAIEAACDDPFVEFDSSSDDPGEWSDPGEGQDQDKTMADYIEKEAVTLLEATEEGESFKRLTLTERREDGESVEYLSIKEGYVTETQTVDGQTVLAQNINNNRSLGFAPENIDQLIDGLEEMRKEIN